MHNLIDYLWNCHQHTKGYIDTIYLICNLSNVANLNYDKLILDLLETLFGKDIFLSVIMILNYAANKDTEK
jgi:hypothetical protein